MTELDQIGLAIVALLVGAAGLIAEILQHRYAAKHAEGEES